MNDEKKLFQLKDKLSKINTDLIRSQERLDQYLFQLESEFSIDSIEQAKIEFETLSKDIPILSSNLSRMTDKAESLINKI